MNLPPILLIGGDGFIGRHFASYFRAQGTSLLVSARRTWALEAMGFDTLKADLSDPATHDPEFWQPHLAGGRAVINLAGLLTGTHAQFDAVHIQAPKAIYEARDRGAPALLISAIGIDHGDTRFAHFRREGEALAAQHNVTILRPGLVMAETSYGGSSLARALAALPYATPVIGNGSQPFNPIHAHDLAQISAVALAQRLPAKPHPVGGSETVTQAELLAKLRAWMGLAPVGVLPVPSGVALAMGRIGDALKLGPITATAVKQFSQGLRAETSPELGAITPPARGISTWLADRPAGSQDLWHARAYLLRPVLRLTLALLWVVSGLLGLTLPPESFLDMTPGGPEAMWIALARFGGVLDLILAAALLRNWRPGLTAVVQACLVLGYTATFTLMDATLWALPLGGLLKNLPILALIAIWAVLEKER